MNQIVSSTLNKTRTNMSNVFGWFDISQEDRARVSALEPLVKEQLDNIIDDFYARAEGVDHPSEQVNTDTAMEAIREEQKRHFLELVDAGLDEHYFNTRADAGIFNENSGISPAFYLSAYSYFLQRLSAGIRQSFADQTAAMDTILSLHRVASCHKALTMEAFAAARQEAIEAREREYSELPVPVLKMREGLLLVPVVGTLDTHRARMLTTHMLDAVKEIGAKAVVLDITGVDAVDSAVANHLMQAMASARLMGTHSVLTGISVEVAQSLVKLGVTGEALNPAGDLERGIETADRLIGH